MSSKPFMAASPTRRGGIPCYEWSVGERFTALIVHGLGDHGQALPYRWLAEALAAAGGTVVSYDHRGHGAARGGWREAPRLTQLEEDLSAVAGHVRTRYPEAPLAAIGLSMGALLAVRAVVRTPGLFDGVVAAAPPLGPVAAGRAAMWTARVLGGVLPWLALETGIDVSAITDHAEALKTYTGDPHFQTSTRLGLAADLLAAIPDLHRAVLTLTGPALFLHGARDRIAPWPNEAAGQLERAGHRVLTFEEGHHNLFLDHGRQQVFTAIAAWANRLR